MKSLFSITAYLIAVCANLQAQEAVLATYSVNEGLSQSTVTAIYQDAKGYLWVGTGHGLNKFNGYEFETFLHTSDSISISHDVIRGIFEDSASRLWVTTEEDLNVYDTELGVFQVFKAAPFRNNTLRVILEREGYLFGLLGAGGLVKFNPTTGNVVVLCTDTLAKGYCVFSNSSAIWFASQRGAISCYNFSNGVQSRFELGPLKNTNITAIIPLNEGYVGIASSNGFFVTDYEGITCRPFHELSSDRYISAACKDLNGNVWLAIKGHGLLVFDINGNLLTEYGRMFRPRGFPSFDGFSVQELVCDKHGNIWVGTDGLGLIQIRTANLRFGNVHIPRESDDESNSLVWSFYRDESEHLWVGTADGIYIFDQMYNLLHKIDDWSKESNRISVFFDQNESTLIAAGKENILFVNKKDFSYTCEAISSGDFKPSIDCGIKLNDDSIWFGTNMGLVKMNIGSMEQKWETGPAITCLSKTSKGDLYACQRSIGIFKLVSGEWKSVMKFKDHQESYDIVMVRALAETNEGGFWLGTSTGLYEVDSEFKVLKVYSLNNGLPDTYINSIITEGENVLWMSTNRGLSRFNHTTNEFQNFLKSDGLQSNEFNAGSAYRDAHGEMYFGGIEGFNHFNDSRIYKSKSAASLIFENLTIGDNKSPYCDSICNYKVSYDQNGFTLDLCAMDFTNPINNHFAYILDGYDSEYFFSGSNRKVRYSSLPPGNYKFLAMASNSEGTWGQPEVMFSIEIVAPFYLKSWFIILSVLSLAGLMYLWIQRLQRRKFKREIEQLRHQREIEMIRNTISGDIHDEIGAGLTRIALLSDSLLVSNSESTDRRKLGALSQAARSLSSSLKEVIWSTNPGYDNLNDLLVHIRSYASDYLEDANIAVVFDIPGDISNRPLSPVKRRSLFMISKETLTNIVKHSEAKSVRISFLLKGTLFELRIEDDGKGFEISSLNDGYGIANMQKRAQQSGFVLEMDTLPAGGTAISIKGSLIA